MSKFRFLLSSVSAFTVLAGGAVLSTPASATAPYFACSENQIDYVIGEIYDVCGSGGGSATVVCDGSNVRFRSVTCN